MPIKKLDVTERGPVSFIKLIFYSFLKPQKIKLPLTSPTRRDALSNELMKAKVEYIMDGDTVVVFGDSFKLKIRLDAIDCPEDDQPYGGDAKSALIRLIGGRTVYLETHGLDLFGRTLAVIYVMEGAELINVNEQMVMLGHAWVMGKHYYQHLTKSRQHQLRLLARWSKSKKLGLWKTENPIPPWEWRQRKSA